MNISLIKYNFVPMDCLWVWVITVSAQKVSAHKVSKIDNMGQKVSIRKGALIYNLCKKKVYLLLDFDPTTLLIIQ